MAIKRIKWVLLMSALAQLGSAHAEDLLTIYQQALEADPTLKAAAIKVEIGGAQKGQALGQMLPQVSANANWSANNQRQAFPGFTTSKTTTTTHNQKDPLTGLDVLDANGKPKTFTTTTTTPVNHPSSAASSNYPGTRYYLSATQTLMDFGKFWTWRKAQEVENQYIAENREAEHTLLHNVVEKYFDVLEAEDQLYFYQNERQATEKKLEQIQKRYAKQLLKITDVYEMEASLDLIKANEIDAETALVKAKESLKELTGSQPTNLLKLRDDIEYVPVEGALEDWIAVAKSENPALAAQIRAIAAAGNDVAAQKAKNLPVVDLQFNYYDTNTGYQSSKINNTEVQVAAINVTVPIFSGGTAMNQVFESQHRLRLAENENEAKVRALIKETSDAYLSANANVRRIKASIKALESTTKSHEAMEKGFGYGVQTITDVLIAQQNEFKAKRDLSQAKYTYIKNRIRFMHAIGMISVENLQEINDWLQAPAKL